MKYLLILFALATITCCKKTDGLDAELAKLPPITQTGANTFGCLVNGKAYIPSGYDGSFPNFDVIPDPSDSSIDVRTYNMNFNGLKAHLFFGGGGLYNGSIKQFGKRFSSNTSVLGILYINSCYVSVNDTCYRRGYLKMNRYDIQNRIFSGEFECIIIGDGCTDTVRITKGRFDKKL
ncbi:MAG: hypothetical protein MUE72_04120 [Chitinophagaceae bacterium]|jgi:hypothetical protein|nr:hypothetical protein [Chitinophagaceae bacterium]